MQSPYLKKHQIMTHLKRINQPTKMSIKGELQQKKYIVFIFLCVTHQEALTLLDKVRHSNHCVRWASVQKGNCKCDKHELHCMLHVD